VSTSASGLPIVAIVGRPNVGKSTLFNRIVGERAAIVEDRARTTRDRLYGAADWNDRRFVVVDTGGLEVAPGDPIEAAVQVQARLAIAEADVIVLVVDAIAGLTPADREAADLLRTARAPVFVAVNILLHVINFATAPGVYWAFWPLLGWGIGLLAHALATYRWMPFAGKDWEERKIRELMDKERGPR